MARLRARGVRRSAHRRRGTRRQSEARRHRGPRARGEPAMSRSRSGVMAPGDGGGGGRGFRGWGSPAQVRTAAGRRPTPESVGPRWPTCVFSGAHMLLGTPCAAPSLEGRLPVHQLQHESQGKMDGWYQPRAKRVAIAAYIFRKRRCCQGGPTRKRNQEEEANHHHHHLLLPSSSIAHRLPHRDGGPGGSG